jgi:hypothetical protein
MKGSAMGTDHSMWFLHMDERWMHRVCLASDDGRVLVRSQGFFHLEDAKRALAQVMHSEVVLAEAA